MKKRHKKTRGDSLIEPPLSPQGEKVMTISD